MKVYLAQFVGQRDDKISPAVAPVLKLRRCTPEAISAGGADGIIALSASPKEREGGADKRDRENVQSFVGYSAGQSKSQFRWRCDTSASEITYSAAFGENLQLFGARSPILFSAQFMSLKPIFRTRQ